MNHLYNLRSYGIGTDRRFYGKTNNTLETPDFLDSLRDSFD